MEELIKLAGKDTIVKSISIYNTNKHIFSQKFADAHNIELLSEYEITNFTIIKHRKAFFFDRDFNPVGCFWIKHKDGIDRVQECHITNYKL